jgi:hypothetical protein
MTHKTSFSVLAGFSYSQENRSMAKKSSSSGGVDFNMAEEIRQLLEKDQSLTGRQVIDALKAKFPKQAINENSCSVAVVNARRKMGISVIRKRRPAGGPKKTARIWSRAQPVSAAAAAGAPNMDLLVAAKLLLQQCQGDQDVALAAIRQVAALQM